MDFGKLIKIVDEHDYQGFISLSTLGEGGSPSKGSGNVQAGK